MVNFMLNEIPRAFLLLSILGFVLLPCFEFTLIVRNSLLVDRVHVRQLRRGEAFPTSVGLDMWAERAALRLPSFVDAGHQSRMSFPSQSIAYAQIIVLLYCSTIL